MIYYLVTPNYEHTMHNYLAHWAKELQTRIEIASYPDVLHARELPLGTYIFSDLERLLPVETEIATLVWDQLYAAGARLLNHPTRTLRRYDLLTMLHARGRNRFRVVRASDRRAELTYPVFLREEGEHSGSLTRLLRNRRELDEALVGATFRFHQLKTLLVVEYCHTAGADGLFRKYSSFMVGGRVVPCHIDVSRGWMVKDTDVVDESIMAEELHYVQTNPHREWLEETFALAGVDYGRIDYGFLDGAPQVWEINTNPVVILPPEHYTEIHMPVKRAFAARIAPAFKEAERALIDRMGEDFWAAEHAFAAEMGPAIGATDTTRKGHIYIPITVSRDLLGRLEGEQRRHRRFRARRRFMHRLVRLEAFRQVRKVVRPMLTPIAPLVARIRSARTSRHSG